MSQADAVRTPSQAYADGAAAGRWRDDPAQHPALRELDRVQRELLAATPTGWRARLGLGGRPAPVKGCEKATTRMGATIEQIWIRKTSWSQRANVFVVEILT